MGEKGDKLTKTSTVLAEKLLAQLEPVEGISDKKMFGGYGVFHSGKMFALVTAKSLVFFKADGELATEYLEMGAVKHSRMPYYSISEEILDNQDLLISLAMKSINILK